MVHIKLKLLHLHRKLLRWYEHRIENQIVWISSQNSTANGVSNQHSASSDSGYGSPCFNIGLQMVGLVLVDSQKQTTKQSQPIQSFL